MSELIVSVSGIRGITGDSLTPQNIVKYASAFAEYCRKNSGKKRIRIAVGRDGRMNGDIPEDIIISVLRMSGADVINIGVAPTPTVQIATEDLKCSGGISITASHNPQIWNGMKFLNPDGTFLNDIQIEELIKIAGKEMFKYQELNNTGKLTYDNSMCSYHTKKVLNLKILNINKIRKREFRVVVDAVNSSGSYIVPELLEKLGCKVIRLHCDGSGIFPHTPEPIPENLTSLSKSVIKNKADIGIAVDPDADRLVLITDKGKPFGEENTITMAVNYVLRIQSGSGENVTVNLSTTRSVEDVALKFKSKVFRSSVGEINVVNEMKKRRSIIGGEGSGGIIYPELHYGRDSLAGIALVLNELADSGKSLSEYKSGLPEYFIYKSRIENIKDPDKVLRKFKEKYSVKNNNVRINTDDGLKIDFSDHWIHLRKSNTEPIIRIITEAGSAKEAIKINKKIIKEISEIF
ncbi:MAG: phosphoglucosamine mutase [Ignavibacteria bacterium]|nr:phosphoglucosamine mutase [Ignavibacteria bacterium]